jgi:hypothetical protein
VKEFVIPHEKKSFATIKENAFHGRFNWTWAYAFSIPTLFLPYESTWNLRLSSEKDVLDLLAPKSTTCTVVQQIRMNPKKHVIPN